MVYRNENFPGIDLQNLARLSREATPGPWKQVDFQVLRAREYRSGSVPKSVVANCTNYENAALVAAANPEVILSLITELSSLRQALQAIASGHESSSSELIRTAQDALQRREAG